MYGSSFEAWADALEIVKSANKNENAIIRVFTVVISYILWAC